MNTLANRYSVSSESCNFSSKISSKFTLLKTNILLVLPNNSKLL